ncbi:aldehyde dehydrogenase [Nocardioides marmoribigeumensis]|uniref:Aminomuconate-semialdehyde/2-hydroxymuconate-6-semialdehyde dehydrogenase n=1 Tax=Nocardioides marmoribigeumensis TaxID=433649 RepID=A0ABU2BSI9_9ACTN|nr:aldehyde dehydrogenase [Nocardioides marmoribigeumensis]MDR7360688.1 aminomuconate-semialdehyde/2-hydroxymuconate-6-semialdehyde dehydrogenase [Nocardioides marmoribigeumensis]
MTDTFFGHVIDGEEVASIDGKTFDVWNPWSQEVFAQAAEGGPEDADRAVTSARRAFDEGPWPRMGRAERAGHLHALADLMEARADELATLDSTNMGKPFAQAKHDVGRSVWNFRFFADHQRDHVGEVYPMDSGHHSYSEYGPAGVVAAISPWNFPLMMATWKAAPAIAWGNTCVIKPSEDTPASVTMLGRLAVEAGLPPGVLNVLNGHGAPAGSSLTADERVDRVTFTGSSQTGRLVMASAATHLAPVSLELGGKGANIVFDDADLDNAVHWAVESIFRNSGQVCLAGSRLFVQSGIREEFLARFTAAAEALTIGDPFDPATKFSSLASKRHFDKVASYVEGVGDDGGTLLTGGVDETGRWLVRPTIVTGLPLTAPAYCEEIFGPVCVVNTFDSEDEVVALANDTRYGLNAMLFTENLSRAHRVSSRLRAGTVWVNCFFIRDLRTPFGGVGDSGVGREGGDFSREFFTEPKAVVMQISR